MHSSISKVQGETPAETGRRDKSEEGGWISVDRKTSLLSYVQSLFPFEWSTEDLSQSPRVKPVLSSSIVEVKRTGCGMRLVVP